MNKALMLALFVTLLTGPLSACNTSTDKSSNPTTPAAQNAPTAVAGSNEPLATLNGEPITEQEVMAKAKNRMMKLLGEQYNIKKMTIDEIVDDRLLTAEAKKQNTTTQKLLENASKNATAPTDAETRNAYEMMKNGYYKNKAYDTVKEDIKKRITAQKRREAVENYIDGLRNNANLKIMLERPSVEVALEKDDPAQGPVDAPITLIEFSEFQCPFCKRTRPTIAKILETYKGKVHYVFRDFPLSFHQQARPAAIAANCAFKQGTDKYWAFNDKLFENQQSLGEDLYKKTASEIGLDIAKFETCRADKAMVTEIEKDMETASQVGVSGTPAYFINGKFLSGAQPFPAFKEIIDEELAKKGM